MNNPNDTPVVTTAQARITFLEDKLAYMYQYFADRHPGVRVKETGAIAEIWAELDFLYLTADEGVTA